MQTTTIKQVQTKTAPPGESLGIVSGISSIPPNAPSHAHWVLVSNEVDSKSSPGDRVVAPVISGESKDGYGSHLIIDSPPSRGVLPCVAPPSHPGSYFGSVGSLRQVKGRAGLSAVMLPPRVDLSAGHSITMRFINTGSSPALITALTLAGALGGICTVTNSKVVAWTSSLLLKRVTVWPPAGGSASLNWISADIFTKDELADESIPTGITVTRALVFKPPKNSTAGFWQDCQGGTGLFTITATTGSVTDVLVNARIAASLAPGFNSVATATLSSVYYLALDGPTGNTYPPIAVPTTH